MDIANASLLDEGTAAAEAMLMACNNNPKRENFFVSSNLFPQTIEVIKTRAKAINLNLIIEDPSNYDFSKNSSNLCGAIFQNPDNFGIIRDYSKETEILTSNKATPILACDILSLALVKSPKEMGFEVAIGTTQRFGTPMGLGGPHAAFFAANDYFKRKIPGRIIGVSYDKFKNIGYRLTLQTREQHIKREKATSNICTGIFLFFL